MDAQDKIVWSALEYEERERSSDWFWAFGIVLVTSSIAAIIFGNYFFAALLILGGTLLWFFSIKKPKMISYELNDKGFVVENRLYPFKGMKAFWVQVDFSGEQNIKPILFLHSERIFMPILTIPISEDIARDIHSLMLSKNITEVEMKETASEKIMEALGF